MLAITFLMKSNISKNILRLALTRFAVSSTSGFVEDRLDFPPAFAFRLL